MGSFGISAGNITGRGKKKKPTEYTPNLNPQQRSGPDAGVCHQQAGAEQEGMGGIIGASGKDQA